jgi:signal transduction histidine kinase
MEPRTAHGSAPEAEDPAATGRLVGTTLRPPALEAEFRAANLRDDGRDAAVIVGVYLVLSFAFVPNDVAWALPQGRMVDVLLGRVAYVVSGLVVVVAGLRTRSPSRLDWSILANAVIGSLFTILLQSTRPADYYLPTLVNAVWVLIVWAVIPNRFLFQALGGGAITLSCVIWLVAFRTPPPRPVWLLIAISLLTVNLAGAFMSWRLQRSRRLQFLAIREQAEASLRLARASRLVALGRLVSGFAHEINNPLGGTVASVSYASGEVGALRGELLAGGPVDRAGVASRLDDVKEALADAAEGSRRISAIVKALALLGRMEPRRDRVALEEVVSEAAGMLPDALRSRLDLRVETAAATEVLASRPQLLQVASHLLSNAAQAATGDRRISVVVRLGPGGPGKVRLEVADDGDGMAPEVLEHAFDPFFTTRPVGKGMGLGLAVGHAIVTAHGGTIAARSAPGRGTTVTLELPAALEA